MRFIDKKIKKAKKYNAWLKSYKGKNHPKYSSSSFRFYYSIVFDLLTCQEGICAYTEKFLTNVEMFEADPWKNGVCNQFKFSGQLDHYDPKLKANTGWLWDNFFISDSDINMKNKNQLSPKGILKPDIQGFDPNQLLEYDLNQHIFIPKIALSDSKKKDVLHDLYVLGVNFEPIVQLRRKYLNPYLQKLNFRQQSLADINSELFQFYTAFSMASAKIV
jgi:hypothetical protein